jgi:hypothetical protein
MNPLRRPIHRPIRLRQHRLNLREHPDRPWRSNSQRAQACVRVGVPCECNPYGGIDEPPTLTPIAHATVNKNDPRH